MLFFFLFCFPWMKISVLSSQYIIQVFRLINMLLSCIYTFVYFENIAFLRGVTNGQHDKKGTEIFCASSSEVGRWYCNLLSCTFVLLSCYYVFINFLGEGKKWAREKDTSDERVLWSASPLALPTRPNQVQGTRKQEAGFLLACLSPDSQPHTL